MRILHLIPRYAPYVGGSERYMGVLSERLAAEGHAVTVYTTDAWDLEYFWDRRRKRIDRREEIRRRVRVRRFPVRHLPGPPLAYLIYRRGMAELDRLPGTTRLLALLARWTPPVPDLVRALEADEDGPFDLVHTANVPLDSLVWAGHRYARRRGIPFFVTPFLHLGTPDDRQVRKYYTMKHQLAWLADADAVFLMTEVERTFLLGRGMDPARLHVVGVGVDPDAAAGADPDRFRRRTGIRGPIVAFVGTAAYDKGSVHLVEAMARLWRQGKEAELVFAGPSLEPFRRFLAGLSPEVRRRCHLLGFVSEEEKQDLLAAAAVLALPSRTDSFGIVFLEAWLHGKPVVGARAGGIPAVVEDGVDGLLVEFGDVDGLAAALARLLEDRALARRLGTAGQRKVLESYTWDRVYARVRRVYEGVRREALS